MPTELYPNPPENAIATQPEPWIEEPHGLGLLDMLLALAQRKRFILTMTFAGALVMTAIAFLIPPMYTGTASIMPPQQQQSSVSALLGQLGPLASAATGGNLGLKTPGDLYVAILSSRTIADGLIRSFNLRQVYGVSTMFNARKRLKKRSDITGGKEPLIKVSVEDRDPKRAAALANAYLEELSRQNGRLALTESAQRRLFFERQLEAQKKSLADAEVALKATQERTGVLQVNAQVESVIGNMARLRAGIAVREVALSSLKSAATPQNPEVVRQEAELATLRGQLQKLEASGDSGGRGDTLIPTSLVPAVGLQYVRAVRDLKYNETLFELLLKQYEAARIDEAKDAPVVQIVDSAIPPERKSWPPRAAFGFGGAFGSGALACLIVLAGSRFRDPQDADKLRLLKRSLIG